MAMEPTRTRRRRRQQPPSAAIPQPEPPRELKPLEVPCCPQLYGDDACDVLDFHYRLLHPTSVMHNNRRVQVEVVVHARFERCTGPLALGDLVYSTTLFPGETVRLFSTDRRTRFTYDSASQLSYRSQQSSEESYFMSSVSDFMSNLESRETAVSSATSEGKSASKTGASSLLDTILSGPSVSMSGSYNAASTADFLRSLGAHAESSVKRSENATRTINSVSIGEVQTRSHAEGETEDHFESASREFSNPNRCHAVTFFFYQVNKTQTIRFSIESIQRRVIDPAGETAVVNRPLLTADRVETIPAGVLATDPKRLEIEEMDRASARARAAGEVRNQPAAVTSARLLAGIPAQQFEPMPAATRRAALREVDRDLVAQGLITRQGGDITPEMKARLSFVSRVSLPTAGVLVKSCLDECSICEESLQEEIKLELEHKRLQNRLLERQIELLEKSQEYRCCPPSSEETPAG